MNPLWCVKSTAKALCQRVALSMSFWFLFCEILEVARILQMLVGQYKAKLAGRAPHAAKKCTSRPIRRSFLARLSCSNCAQCAKVDPRISLRAVLERSTRCNRLQFSQAAGPIQVKSGGRAAVHCISQRSADGLAPEELID